ncbi:MAG: RHS repeat-associated core domain-containing protein [Bryobacteraceae bacterium]
MEQTASSTPQPRIIRYCGDQLVLIEKDPHGLGPDSAVCFDFDRDGHFEHEIHTDSEGRYCFAFAAHNLNHDGVFSMVTRGAHGGKSEVVTVHAIKEKPFNPACEVPVNRVPIEPPPGEDKPPEAGICTSACTACELDETLPGASLDAYTNSATPMVRGVELATGKLRQSWSITSFATRQLDFDFTLHHSSLVDYNGPWGLGVSHSFNMMIVQDGPLSGQVVTSDLRCYPIYSDDGHEWRLPRNFFSRLRLDKARCRWTMTHFSGLETEFFQGPPGKPGYPLSICDPNRNRAYLEYDSSGLLQCIVTDLEQELHFAYDETARLRAFTDHLGRAWRFGYDERHRLTRMLTPVTEFADIAACQEITEHDLPGVLAKQPRTTLLGYSDERFPSHITSIADQRGATPESRVYDSLGRVRTTFVNGMPIHYDYQVEFALDKLEAGNLVTRVTDREGNVNDYEIHGTAGGALNGRGRFGLRRQITWTERGKGNPPLRMDEPAYWEQRWLHDCNCLAPIVATQPFSSDDAKALNFDDAGIPTDWPRTVYAYNDVRQVLVDLYTDGAESIRTESAYQEQAFGDERQYSRKIRWTEPRGFDDNPIYAGLGFTHSYRYDARGNRTRHDAPTVTRGVDAPQIIAETWSYNEFGQVLQHTGPNGNITANAYYDGPSTGGDINAKGPFGGYLRSVTRGAGGSKDAATNLTTTYLVNPLGMTTREIDPKGFIHDTEYNNLQERVRWIEPRVTLRQGAQVRYETRWVYDGAGNEVLERRSNIDLDGAVPANRWIDRSMSYDNVRNLLSDRAEVDADGARDLTTRHAYDRNDDRVVTQRPEGNREFRIYDERRLLLATFYGVAPGGRIDDGYPSDKRAHDLGSTAFVGATLDTYDARLNLVRHRDGRGNLTGRFFDFYNRQIAESDPNGNGWVRTYDDDSNVLTTARGAVSRERGEITELLEQTFERYDEAGRGYQRVLDIDLGGNEQTAVDPDDGKNSSYRIRFDPGARTVLGMDANGNTTAYGYDAADRILTVTDALGNVRAHAYDGNSNIVRITETEVPGPGAAGDPETWVITFAFDEVNRQTERRILGLNGNSIDHAWFFAYDSRGNERLMRDAENNVTRSTFDYADRLILRQRFDGDPLTGDPLELLRYEWVYDRNDRAVEERALSDVTDPASVQITRHAYDDLDRQVRTVFPDSDDPIDGAGSVGDGLFDRVELGYDANSNLIRITDQREVVFTTAFDPGNRPVSQSIVKPASVPGVTRQAYAYDVINRVITADNDYARVANSYDPLSRLTSEAQSIRLDGSGFANGWENPIRVSHAYDRQSNATRRRVLDGARTDLAVSTTFDALNREVRRRARYFDTSMHDIATYAYLGPSRVQTKTLGNGAVLTRRYDSKRRTQSHSWTGSNRLLVGFEYGYDRMDNALYERFTHDSGLYDHFQYNDRYEVVAVDYRAPGATPPVNPRTRFFYDDVFNRTQATFGDPFGAAPDTVDSYAANRANEYTRIKRNGKAVGQTHDRAGNLTQLLARPAVNRRQRADVFATARWDAHNLLFSIDTGVTPAQDYRYDAFRRRIATLELDGDAIRSGARRYIYDRWEVVEERLIDDGAKLPAAPSTLERVYVTGREIDEPLLTAIDSTGDRRLGGGAPKNRPGPGADKEYYFLNNRLGSVMALLDADRADGVLERYRYTVYGEVQILPSPDDSGDDPEGAPGVFGNSYRFTARRHDEKAGLYYCRNRFYEPASGRFISRDPLLYVDGPGVYAYTNNNPTGYKDWSGTELTPVPENDGCDGYVHFYSTQEHKTRVTAEARARAEIESPAARALADLQCQAVATRINKACILRKGPIITRESANQTGGESARARRDRKRGREEAVKKGAYRKSCGQNWVARANARWRCRSVRTLRDELARERRYIEQDLDAIEYEKNKRKWVRHVGIAILGAASVYGLARLAFGGGAAAGLAGLGARLRVAVEARRFAGAP